MFSASLFKFLEQLQKNNNRDWFDKNKDRYETEVREPCFEFITAMQPALKKISPHFTAVAKKSGGSLMRVYRDTRFAKDKTPYKTNVGINFRHEMGKDVHAPGFYVHFEPKQNFICAGMWHPDSEPLKQIRAAIDERSKDWKRVRDGKKFREHFELVGDSLKSAPRGYAKDHPLIDDLKRKDFIGMKSFTRKEVLDPQFLKQVVTAFTASKPFLRFLCDAVRVPC